MQSHLARDIIMSRLDKTTNEGIKCRTLMNKIKYMDERSNKWYQIIQRMNKTGFQTPETEKMIICNYTCKYLEFQNSSSRAGKSGDDDREIGREASLIIINIIGLGSNLSEGLKKTDCSLCAFRSHHLGSGRIYVIYIKWPSYICGSFASFRAKTACPRWWCLLNDLWFNFFQNFVFFLPLYSLQQELVIV